MSFGGIYWQHTPRIALAATLARFRVWMTEGIAERQKRGSVRPVKLVAYPD